MADILEERDNELAAAEKEAEKAREHDRDLSPADKVIEELMEPVEGVIVEKKRWVLFALPFTFTKYTIRKDVLTVNTGFLSKQENDCYMYKIQDVKLMRSLFQRMSGLGTVVCYTGDTTSPELRLKNIKHSKEAKDYILKNSEVARLKRRTLTTLNIGANDISEMGFN